MYKITTYYAFDDTAFKTEEECIAYENERNNKFKRVIENIILFDKDGFPTPFKNEKEFISIYEDCQFFICKDNLEDDDTSFLEERGYIDIPHERGFYHNENYEWVEFYEAWAPLIPYIIGEKSI